MNNIRSILPVIFLSLAVIINSFTIYLQVKTQRLRRERREEAMRELEAECTEPKGRD